MGANALLDVAIGLALLYLLLSLFVTVINEWIGGLFKLRAQNLRNALHRLIDDPTLLTHIRKTAVMTSLANAAGRVGPSYIPSDRFSKSVIDALTVTAGVVKIGSDASIRDRVAALPDSNIKRQLLSILDQTGADVAQFQAEISRWFDDMMDRASGIYTRWMQVLSLVVAAVLTVGMNVNSIAVARALWADDDLRAQIAEGAGQYIADRGDLADLAEVESVSRELRPFPIGWETLDAQVQSPSDYVILVVGWFLTAAAISLGAPFWFGVLQKVTKIRGAGKVPGRAE